MNKLTAEQSRAQMPSVAAMVDKCREFFGDGVRVTYASENGITRGTPSVCEGVIVPAQYIGKPARHELKTTTLKRPNTRRP